MAKERILVVDDEKDIVEIIRELLEAEGYKTLAAYDGQEALDQLQRHRVDGIVLDIKMPVLDGIGVIERVRAEAAIKDLPVVVLTATQVIREAQEQLKKLKVNAWLSKPFEPDELIAAVAKVLKRGLTL